jgi:hypothetical protein
MICSNGKQMTPKGDTGIFFICQEGEHKGNQCRFVRWCALSREYVMISLPIEGVCADFTASAKEI